MIFQLKINLNKKETEYLHSLIITPKRLLITKRGNKVFNSAEQKPGKHHLSQVTKINIPNNEINGHHVLPNTTQ